MQQIVQNRRLGALRGALLILEIIVGFFVISYLSMLVQRLNIYAGVILFWGLGGVCAWWILYRYVLAFRYTWNGMVLRVERMYGKRVRFQQDVFIRHLKAVGPVDEVKARFPKAKMSSAVRRDCPYARVAAAYEDGKTVRICVLQPDPDMLMRLTEAVKR